LHVTIVEQKIVSGRVVVKICNVGRIGSAVVACIYMIYLSGNERDHGISGSPRGSYYRMLSPIPFSPCRSKSHPLPFLLLSSSNPLSVSLTLSLSPPRSLYRAGDCRCSIVYPLRIRQGRDSGFIATINIFFPLPPGRRRTQ